MKKTYEKPHLEVVELRYQKALLLPVSGALLTDEVLAPDYATEVLLPDDDLSDKLFMDILVDPM
jgi:hypothetical protein